MVIQKSNKFNKTFDGSKSNERVTDMYNLEYLKQMDVQKNNDRLDKDINKFSKNRIRILNSLKGVQEVQKS